MAPHSEGIPAEVVIALVPKQSDQIHVFPSEESDEPQQNSTTQTQTSSNPAAHLLPCLLDTSYSRRLSYDSSDVQALFLQSLGHQVKKRRDRFTSGTSTTVTCDADSEPPDLSSCKTFTSPSLTPSHANTLDAPYHRIIRMARKPLLWV